jgi:glycosyltransferase involved in cell wall biosynthesis
MPRVSIVMPTRNRAQLLKVALQSALRQTYHDIEIVVSDNYCGNEETKKVYESFQDSRLRYVRTDRLLAMPDSWEFALSHAKGDYVTFLTDDSYLLSYAVEKALATVDEFKTELVAWDICSYVSPEWAFPMPSNVLSFRKPQAKRQVFCSRDLLQQLYEHQLSDYAPKFLNSLCHQQLIARVLGIQKRMFLPPAPDYTGAVSLLVNTDRYVFLHWPLVIAGTTPRSIGAAALFNDGDAFKEFINEFDETESFRQPIGLDLRTAVVCAAQSIENVKRAFYSEQIPFVLNRLNMLCESIETVARYERNGADTRALWRIIDDYIAGQDENFKRAAAVRKRRSKLHSKLLTPVWRIFRRMPGGQYLERLTSRLRGEYLFHGTRYGFENLEQCGELAPQLIASLADNAYSSSA